MTSSDLELFEVELLKEFPKTNITSIASYNDNIVVGDAVGNLTSFKREKSKLVQKHHVNLKSKIENLIAIPNKNVLFVLAGGNLTYYNLMSFDCKSPKEQDKDYKDFKEVAKIAENKKPENEDEILIVYKKKKIQIFHYVDEISKLSPVEYLDKEGKPLNFNLDEIPEKIMWHGNHICYFTKGGKLVFNIISTIVVDEKKISEKKEVKHDLLAEDLIYVNKTWVFLMGGGVGVFYDLEGQPLTKSTLVFNQNEKEPSVLNLGVLNDFHVVSLSKINIEIVDNNDGQLMQTLNIDNKSPEFKKIFLAQGQNSVFALTSNKKDDKTKDFVNKLWEVREFSFEKQIKIAIKLNQIEKAFNILNNNVENNEEKFKFLESFYCDCGWNCINQKNEEGYKMAKLYFGLCNFNPYELIYHFIKLLKIKPIHEGFQDERKLPPEVDNCQIISKEESLDKITIAALEMLIQVLKAKKNYILQNNLVINNKKEKGKKKSFQSVKNSVLTFESSQNCPIDLQDIRPTDIKLFETINIIDEALVNSMVLLGYKINFIDEIIEDNRYTNNYYPEEFLKNLNNFTSRMALACIYKRNKKFEEAFNILEPNINNMDNPEQNMEAVNLLKKILIGFGTNTEYVSFFEKGVKLLLANHPNIAFEVILYNELIDIDNVLQKILPESNEPDKINKRENFLKLLCDDQHYSNEKYQTLYIELLIKKIFSESPSKDIPRDKEGEKQFPKGYNDFKNIIKKYDKYDIPLLIDLVKNTWMYDIEIYLLSQSKKNDEAIKLFLILYKSGIKTFEDIREFCRSNYSKDTEIFKKYFQKLREQYDDKDNKDTKLVYKKEMLKIIDLFITEELLDKEQSKNKNKLELLNILNPKEILSLIPSDWKLNEPLDENQKDPNNSRTIFNLMHFYLKEYTIINNNYKRLENLAKMDLIYKQKQLYELRDKHIQLDVNSCCYLCGKKIVNNTQLMIYPNGHIYHAKCSPDIHLEIKTGKNFKNFDY